MVPLKVRSHGLLTALPERHRRELHSILQDCTFQAATAELQMKEPSLQLGSEVCINISSLNLIYV